MEYKTITIRTGDDYQAIVPELNEQGPDLDEGTVLFDSFAENNTSKDFLHMLSKIYYTEYGFFDQQEALTILQKCDFNLEKALYLYFHPLNEEESTEHFDQQMYSDFFAKLNKEIELKDSLKLVDLQLKTNEYLTSHERVTYQKLVKHKENLKASKISETSQQLLEDVLVSIRKWEDYLKLNISSPQTLSEYIKLLEDTRHRFPFLKSKEITMIKNTIDTATHFNKTAELLIHKVATMKKTRDNNTEINKTIKEIGALLGTTKPLEDILVDSSYKVLANKLSAYYMILKVYVKKEKGVYYTNIEYLHNKINILKVFDDSVKDRFLLDYKRAKDLNKEVETLLRKKKDSEAKSLATTAKQLPFHALNFAIIENRVKKTFFLDQAKKLVQYLGSKHLPEEELWILEEGSKKYLTKDHSLFGTIDLHLTELLKLKYSLSKLLSVSFPHVGVRNINYSNIVVNKTPLSIDETDKLIKFIKRSPFVPTEYLKKIESIFDVSIDKKKRILNFIRNRNTKDEDFRLTYDKLKELNEINTYFIDIYDNNNKENKENAQEKGCMEQFKKSVSKCLKVKTKLEHVLSTIPIKEKDIKQILAILANDAVLKRVELSIKDIAIQKLEESKHLTNYLSNLSLSYSDITNNNPDDDDNVIDITLEDSLNSKNTSKPKHKNLGIEFYELSENLNKGKIYRNFIRKDNYDKATELIKRGSGWLEIIKNKMPGIDAPVADNFNNKRNKTKSLDIEGLKEIINSKPIELKLVRFGRLEDMVSGFIDNVEKLKTDINKLCMMKMASIKNMTEEEVKIVVGGFMSLLNPILSLNVEVGFKEANHRDAFLVLKCFHTLFNLTKSENYINAYVESLNHLLAHTNGFIYIVFSKSAEFKSILRSVSACLKWSSKVNYKLFDYFNEATYYILGINYQLDNTRKLGSMLSIDYKRLEDLQLEKDDHKVEVYCYCKIPHDDELFMLMCDSCLQWYHLECALLGSSDVNNDQDSFSCLECCVENGQKFKFLERILWTTKDTRPSKFGIIKNKPDSEIIGSFISDFRNLKLKNIKMYEVEKLEKVLLGVSEWSDEAEKIIKQLKTMNQGKMSNMDRLIVQRAFSYMCKGAANYLKTNNLNELMKHLLDSVIILNIDSFYRSQKGNRSTDFNWRGIFGFTYSKQKLNFKELEVLYKKLFKFGFVEVVDSVPANNGKKGEVEKTMRIKRSTTHVRTFLDFYSKSMNIHESLKHALNEKMTLDEADQVVAAATNMKVVFFEDLKVLKGQLMKIRKVSEKVTEFMRTKTLTYSKIIALSNELSVDGGKIVSPVKQLLIKEKKKADDWTSRFHKSMGKKNIDVKELEGLMKELQGAHRACVDARDVEKLRKGIRMIQSGAKITEEVKNKKPKVIKSNFKYFIGDSCFVQAIKKGLIGLLKKNKTGSKGIMFVKNYLDGIPMRIGNINSGSAICDLHFAKLLQIVDVSSDFEELKSKLTPFVKKLLDSGKISLEDCKRLITTRNQTQQLLMNYIIKLEKLCPEHGKK